MATKGNVPHKYPEEKAIDKALGQRTKGNKPQCVSSHAPLTGGNSEEDRSERDKSLEPHKTIGWEVVIFLLPQNEKTERLRN